MLTIFVYVATVAATIHLMMATVLALYARYKVEYLALAWIMGIFGALCCVVLPFGPQLGFDSMGLLHPFMMLIVVATTFLQSIYPLSIPMPGYLQWQRMLSYAFPAILLIILYVFTLLVGGRPVIVKSFVELAGCWYRPEMLFRLGGLGLSVYYTVNILRLPHLLARTAEIPRYIKSYTVCLGLNMSLYVLAITIYTPELLMVYLCLFCIINMYLFYRTLEPMAMHLPKPESVEVERQPDDEEVKKVADVDFNEANRKRFERVEYFMQHNDVWRDNTFGRDKLCEATGLNRHLLLQCLRSRGYYNCHEYINSYRIAALKRGVESGEIVTVADCVVVGFGSSKTARSCFERMEGYALDDYLKSKARVK